MRFCGGREAARWTAVSVIVLAWGSFAVGGDSAPGAAAGATVVLANDSYLRSYYVFRTPVFVTKDGTVKTALEPLAAKNQPAKPIADFQSPLPPADWVKAGFDDSPWDRRRAPVEVAPGVATGRSHAARYSAAGNSLICLRGRFVVSDPAGVRDLKVSLRYVGGVVVYVNGAEVARGSMPAGPVAGDTLAEKYPDDLYCEAGGAFLQDPGKNPAGFARRYRSLDAGIPSALLRKGTNVLALEIHRAPVNEAAIEAGRVPWAGMYEVAGIWSYAGLKDLSVTAGAGSAVVPNIARPRGVEVWNCAPFDTLTVYDYGDRGEAAPVSVVSPRNGVFSGRLVVSSDESIRGLKVTVSDLARVGGGGKIGAAAVRVRCAAVSESGKSWLSPTRFDGLLDAMPVEVPVVKAAAPQEFFLRLFSYPGERIDRKNVTSGALAPVWLTVRVPREAAAGDYEGTVSIAAEGTEARAVPLRLRVSGWTMREPKDFRIHNFAYLSEDAIAKHYSVERWSDRHFELMGRSMALMAEVNSRQAVVNLAINFYGGANSSNEESLVRWTKQADGSYKHDFTVVDKYLETVAKAMGTPSLLRVNCWGELTREGKNACAGFVSLWDAETKTLGRLEQPTFGTEESFAFWKPVLDEVRKRIEARGWFDVTAVGYNSYCYGVTPQIVGVYKRIWPDGAWSYTAHNGTLNMSFASAVKGEKMPVRHSDCVWTRGQMKPRGYQALFQPRSGFWCFTFRGIRDAAPLTTFRGMPEEEIMCGHDGYSDFGADLFPLKGPGGRGYYCVGNGRGTGGPSDGTQALLAPGPAGAIATERFEMLREGVELGEAILFIQKALDEKRIAGELAERANQCLDERGEAHIRGWWGGRLARDARLLALAGEVSAKLAEK